LSSKVDFRYPILDYKGLKIKWQPRLKKKAGVHHPGSRVPGPFRPLERS
jgi:hypothetical protein